MFDPYFQTFKSDIVKLIKEIKGQGAFKWQRKEIFSWKLIKLGKILQK